MARQVGLFDIDERLRRLSDIGDQLGVLAAVVDFEIVRPDLVAAPNYSDAPRGGAPSTARNTSSALPLRKSMIGNLCQTSFNSSATG